MSAKATFRDGVRCEIKSTYWGDDFKRPDDADLDPELAEIIVHWRGTFAQSRPSSQDTKQTLRKLRTLDDEHIVRAVKLVDPWTESALWRLPSNPTPDQIRDEARRVLHKMKHVPSRPGRPVIQSNDVWMGVDLARWWEVHHGKRPAVTAANGYTSQESEFLTWATEKFHRAGRVVSADAIVKSLRQAVRIADKLKTRTE